MHLSSVLGRTELCHEVWSSGPQKPQIISNENHHLALLESSMEDWVADLSPCNFATAHFSADLVARCSATPASVAATPPCSATPFQRQLDVRHSWQFKGDRCDRAFQGGCSAILLLHLKNPRIPRKSAATGSATGGPRTRVQLRLQKDYEESSRERNSGEMFR